MTTAHASALDGHLDVEPAPTKRNAPAVWWTVLAVALLAIEPSKIGLASGPGASFDLLRFVVIIPLYGGLLVGALLSPAVGRLAGLPVRWLAAAAVWAVLAAPFGESPMGDVTLAVGELAVVLAAVAMVGHFGWDRWMGVVTLTLAAVIAVSVVIDPPSGVRTAGLFAAPNTLGTHGAIVAVDALRRWLTGHRTGWVVVCGVGWAGMLAADSRTAMAAAVVGSILLTRHAIAPRLRWPVTSVVAAAVAVFATTEMGRSVGSSLTRSGNVEELTTGTGRTAIWRLDLDWIAERWLFGWGHSGATRPFADALANGDISWDAQEAHNTVLQAGIQSGVVALVLVTIAGLALVRRMLRHPHTGADAVAAVILLHGVMESLFREPRAVWLVLAGAAVAGARTPVVAKAAARS